MANQSKTQSDPLIISYLTLRRLVGWIAIGLPCVLLIGNAIGMTNGFLTYVTRTIFYSSSIPDSMSGYYYTGLRNFFVGSLCALGVFLVSYNGHGADRWITNVAGAFAICVAFLPTKPTHPTGNQSLIGNIHLFCAMSLVLLMAVMSLRFTKTDHSSQPSGLYRAVGLGRGGPPPDPADARWNLIFRGCAAVIVLSVAMAVIANFLPTSVKMHPWLFWCEAAAVWAFGLSWSTKGRALEPVMRAVRRNPAAAVPEASPASP